MPYHSPITQEGVEQHEESLRGYQFPQGRVSTPQSTSHLLLPAGPAWRRGEVGSRLGWCLISIPIYIIIASLGSVSSSLSSSSSLFRQAGSTCTAFVTQCQLTKPHILAQLVCQFLCFLNPPQNIISCLPII